MRNNIDIAFGEENQVGEAVEIPKTGGTIFHDLEDAIDALADSVGDVKPLVLAELGVEKLIDCLTAFAKTDPHDNGAVEVVNNGRELAALTVGDLVNAKCDKTAYLMAFSYAGDDAVQDI